MGVSIFNTGYDLQDQIDAAESAIAIVSIGDTHVAITSGQYVYVREHGTLAEGLYKATSNIAANATLSSSNVTAVSGGGLNALNSKISDINTRLFFGNSDTSKGTHYNTNLTTGIDAIVDSTISPTNDSNGYFTINNSGSNSPYGNRQFLVGWVNREKTFGWVFIYSFDHVAYGVRANSSTFNIIDITNLNSNKANKIQSLVTDGTTDNDGDIPIQLSPSQYVVVACYPDRTAPAEYYTNWYNVLPFGSVTGNAKYSAKCVKDNLEPLVQTNVRFTVYYIQL